jgi:coenzyme F420-reducing hydrogenase delta subunit/biotin operon repressor
VSRQQYATDIRLIRVMCSGRVDLSHVLRAFRNGMDGVFIGGCHFNECHYITDGNYHALSLVLLAQKLLAHLGLDPARLRLEELSAGEGIRFAEVMNEFAVHLKRLGPLGTGEGLEPAVVSRRLAAAAQLVPYLRLVERERLRLPERSADAYRRLYASPETERLFQELVADKLAVAEIVALLREGPQSTAELSQRLGLSPSAVARHVKGSSKHGLVKYDVGRGRYFLA